MSAPTLSALAALARLLDAALRGAALQRLRDPDPHTLALKLRAPGRTYFLTLSARPEAPGVRVGYEQPPTLPEPHGVGRWARAHLEGARVEGVELVGGDRVLAVRTRAGALYLELLPSLENLYAVDAEGRVRAWLHRAAGRDLALGQPWRPPPRPEGFEQAREEARGAEEGAAPLTSDEARALLAPLIEEAQARAEEAGEDRASREGRERAKLIKQVRARLTRLSEALWGDIGRADEAAAWGRHAELLKGRLRDLRRGLTSVRVTDWFDPELREVEIPLDPKLDGLENMERLFQRQRKALRGAEMATERLERTERQLAELESIVEERAEEPLEDLRAALRSAGLLRERAQGAGGQGGARGERAAPRRPYRVFHSAQGEAIWLGRGGADNHATTFQHARGQDHWVHTRDVPGAHVIIPLPRRGHTPHPETVLDAAALAVHHSSQRDEQGVPVYHTERKHVRPVPGGPPGKVMVADSRALAAEGVEERVARLYAEAQRRGEV